LPWPHRNADGDESVGDGGSDVEFAVADHGGGIGLDMFSFDQPREQFAFVGARAVEFAAVDSGEMPGQVEMLKNWDRKLCGFDVQTKRRCDCASVASASGIPGYTSFS